MKWGFFANYEQDIHLKFLNYNQIGAPAARSGGNVAVTEAKKCLILGSCLRKWSMRVSQTLEKHPAVAYHRCRCIYLHRRLLHVCGQLFYALTRGFRSQLWRRDGMEEPLDCG